MIATICLIVGLAVLVLAGIGLFAIAVCLTVFK